jgi:amino acid adenylation domain-containing protein
MTATQAAPRPHRGMTEPPLATARPGPDPAFERPLFDVFAEIAASQPDHLAVDDGTARLTYAELHDRALALGGRVAAQVAVDGLLGVLVPTTVLYPVAWLACFAARRAFLPLDPHLPPARNQAIIAEAGLAALIVPTKTADVTDWLPADLPRIAIAAEPPLTPSMAELAPQPPPLPPGLPPSEMAMVLFTSGSTGRAKGIALHERTTLRKALNYRASCALGPDDRMLSLHPPPTGAGARDTMGALLCGASLHLVDPKRDGLAPALALLRDGGITVCVTAPGVARALMAMDSTTDAFRALRVVRLGGDVIMDSDITALARRLAPTARILVGFGMTETGGALLQRVIDPSAAIEPGRIAVGTPVPGLTVSVEDANGNPVRPGETGELVIRGPYVALGHWKAGRLDPSAFPTDPSAPGSRCYRSGDMVFQRADGMIVPLGRSDRQVKINGIRVEPEDTEAALRGLPGVADAVVLAYDDGRKAALAAFVVPASGEHTARQGASPSLDRRAGQWRSALAALLPPQLVPARIRVVPAIPLLPSMKPDLAALRALLEAEDAPGVLAGIRAWLRGHRPHGPAVRRQPPVRRDGTAP